MERLLRVSELINAVNLRIGQVVVWLTLVMILVGFVNAALRYAGRWAGVNLTSNLAIEAQWYVFSLLFLLLGAYTLQRDRHVRVDIFYGRLEARGQAWVNLVGAVVFLIPFCALILWMSWPFVMAAIAVWERSPDPGGLPRWPIKIAIPVAFALMIGQGVAFAIRNAAVILGHLPSPKTHTGGTV